VDRKDIHQITRDRLDSWLIRLVEQHSTPVLLLGVGHDHRSGQLTVITLEGLPDQDVETFLSFALDKLNQT